MRSLVIYKCISGSRDIAPAILILDTTYEWWASCPSRFVPRRMKPLYPVNKKLGWPRAGLNTEQRKTILASTGN